MAIEDLVDEPKPAAHPVVPDAKQTLPPAQQNVGPGYQGLLLLDWDGTIVNAKNQFINILKTGAYLRFAFENKLDIHIVTARPNTPETFKALLNKLKQLHLVDDIHNEAFWREHIHCVVQDLEEHAKLDKDSHAHSIIGQRKKACIEAILAKPEYLHLQKPQIHFYDDNEIVCDAVKKIEKVTVIQAKANGSHFDILHQSILSDIEKRNKEQQLRDYYEKLNSCLNAMYPDRAQWGDNPNINAGGVKELHRILKAVAAPKDFTLAIMMDIYNVIHRRLQKSCVGCLPTFFGGRDAFVQQLYSSLNYYPRLDSLNFPNKKLDALLLRIQARNAAQQNAAPVAHVALAVR